MMRFLLALAAVLCARGQALPQFDVATVKLSPPPQGDTFNINLGTARNEKITLTNASLSDCLKFAYSIVSNDQLSGPDWIKSKDVRFDIVAQAPPETPRDRLLVMLQALLADRLKLALHHEQKELRYLALVVGKGGPKFHAATPLDPAISGSGNSGVPGRIVGTQMTMLGLATLLTRFGTETVVDMTGLKGAFELKLEWSPKEDDGPSVFTAVQEQLGLKVESRKGPLDVLVVDHAERVPAEN